MESTVHITNGMKYIKAFFLWICVFSCFSVNAATWKNPDSDFDINSLTKNQVPSNFPEYSLRAYETCKTSKGSNFSNDIEIYVSANFLWGSKFSYNGDWVRIYVGERIDSGKFLITV